MYFYCDYGDIYKGLFDEKANMPNIFITYSEYSGNSFN